MKQYQIKAYGEEYGLPNKSATIEAENKEQAQARAWEMFPEYDDVGVSEMTEDEGK